MWSTSIGIKRLIVVFQYYCLLWKNDMHILRRYVKNLPLDSRCHRNTHHTDDRGNVGNKPPRAKGRKSSTN